MAGSHDLTRARLLLWARTSPGRTREAHKHHCVLELDVAGHVELFVFGFTMNH